MLPYSIPIYSLDVCTVQQRNGLNFAAFASGSTPSTNGAAADGWTFNGWKVDNVDTLSTVRDLPSRMIVEVNQIAVAQCASRNW